MDWKIWKERSKWRTTDQLPRWVKKEFGWYCPIGSDEPCPKHGLYDFQHPKYLKGNRFEYKIVDVSEPRNNHNAIVRRMRRGRNFRFLILSVKIVRKIRTFFIRQNINQWVDSQGNVPDWVKEKIKGEQNNCKIPGFLIDNKTFIFKGRHSYYKALILNREKIGTIYRRKKKRGVPDWAQNSTFD